MIFVKFEHIDWSRCLIVLAVVMTFWTGIQTVVPQKHYTTVMTVLTAVQSALLLLVRGGKYVQNRTDPTTINGAGDSVSGVSKTGPGSVSP